MSGNSLSRPQPRIFATIDRIPKRGEDVARIARSRGLGRGNSMNIDAREWLEITSDDPTTCRQYPEAEVRELTEVLDEAG